MSFVLLHSSNKRPFMSKLKNNYCVIMAGGVGTRFWPMSRTTKPKQFIDILGIGKTLIQLTFERFRKICPPENVFVVTNEIYKDLVLEQLPELNENQVLCEPAMRNTAPCVAYANYKINEINPNALVVVAPSDHIILKEDAFVNDINTALKAASKNDCLLTLGIKPSRPDTGYGYIQFLEDSISNEIFEVKKVKTFTEKPNLEYIPDEYLLTGVSKNFSISEKSTISSNLNSISFLDIPRIEPLRKMFSLPVSSG